MADPLGELREELRAILGENATIELPAKRHTLAIPCAGNEAATLGTTALGELAEHCGLRLWSEGAFLNGDWTTEGLERVAERLGDVGGEVRALPPLDESAGIGFELAYAAQRAAQLLWKAGEAPLNEKDAGDAALIDALARLADLRTKAECGEAARQERFRRAAGRTAETARRWMLRRVAPPATLLRAIRAEMTLCFATMEGRKKV